MKERGYRPKGQQETERKGAPSEARQSSPSFPRESPGGLPESGGGVEQQPFGGGINKPELRPPRHEEPFGEEASDETGIERPNDGLLRSPQRLGDWPLEFFHAGKTSKEHDVDADHSTGDHPQNDNAHGSGRTIPRDPKRWPETSGYPPIAGAQSMDEPSEEDEDDYDFIIDPEGRRVPTFKHLDSELFDRSPEEWYRKYFPNWDDERIALELRRLEHYEMLDRLDQLYKQREALTAQIRALEREIKTSRRSLWGDKS